MLRRLKWKKKSVGSREGDVFIHLRRIHASWMLWLVAVVFTVIISPYMFLMYQIPGAFIVIFAALCVSTLGGNKLGNKIIDRVFLNELKQEHELGTRVLWITRLSLILFPIILLMDVTSVAAESYNYMYWASVTLLILLTILLLVSVRKRGGEK
jgi:amino acid transporter